MVDGLQELVEGLAQDLGRSVAVDDADLRLLASSTHFEDVDQARLGSLVGRRVIGASRDYVLGHDVLSWREPARLPACPAVGIDNDRYCFPLRSRYELLGFMWLIDDGTLTEAQVAQAAESVGRVEDVLARRSQTEVSADAEVEARMSGLLASDPAVRAAAAEGLRGLGILRRADHVSVLAVRLPSDETETPVPVVRDAVRRGMGHAVQGRLRESYGCAPGADRPFLVVGHRGSPAPGQLLALATTLRAEIERVDPAVAAGCTVGVGEPVPRLDDVAGSLEQAVVGADVARDLGRPAAAWADHPLEALTRSWLRPALPQELVPPVIARLMAEPDELVEALEVYLDAGSSVAEAASRLHVHRTTIYYRLNRLQESTGIDLNDGASRLLVHLWLKGRHVSRVEG